MLWNTVIVPLLGVFALLSTVSSKAFMSVHFVRFDNPGGKGDNGHCCDGRLIFCPSKCDHHFIICVDGRYGRRDTYNCPYGKKRTGVVEDQDMIVFGSTIGDQKNPMTFDFDSWPGTVQVKVEVYDRDDSNRDDKVGFLTQDISLLPARSESSAVYRRYTLRARVSLILGIKVFCGPSFYGPACDVLCLPRADRLAGYECDPSTGNKICLDGWTGENCDVSVDDCLTNKCEHGATCFDAHLSYTCICPSGYEGPNCASEIDECLSNPCQNNGTCHDQVNAFSCECDSDWTGLTCQIRDWCKDVPCANGGTCYIVNNSFICKCPPGFTGTACETDVDECISAPCQHGGTCTDLHNGFNCTCSAAWQGVMCENDVDECSDSPCAMTSRCQNLPNHFACVCNPGYTGKLCDADINECQQQPCQNGGSCSNETPGFQCTCIAGFYGDTCERDVDECISNPCAEGSTCINLHGSFECLCKPDFTGPTCGLQIDDCLGEVCEHGGTCVDDTNDFLCVCIPEYTGRKCDVYIDRCQTDPCQNLAQCIDNGYGYPMECRCSLGWTGHLCDQDVDECLREPCANGARCVNTPGNFTCICSDGWTGGLCQEDINECQLLMDQEKKQNQTTALVPASASSSLAWCQHAGVCVNVDGGFFCACLQGWQGQLCQKDVDECRDLPCQHQAPCQNTPGGFHCTCPQNWTGQFCQADVDECEQSPCSKRATCLNTQGSFKCSCPLGWQGDSCDEDIDECLGDGLLISTSDSSCLDNDNCSNRSGAACQNNATCLNIPGSFWCSCASGWSGHYCQLDVDECVVGTDIADVPGWSFNSSKPLMMSSRDPGIWSGLNSTTNSSSNSLSDTSTAAHSEACLNGGTCQNTAGHFSCLCGPGWSGTRCNVDVDECSQGLNPCLNNGQCLNFPGGFHCTCVGPWKGDLCSQPKDECIDEPCRHNATCIARSAELGGGVQCICPRGWRGQWCQLDRNECALNQCLNGGTCVNERGHFRCLCPENVTGQTCSNSTRFDKGVSVPLYFQGHLKAEEANQVRSGIKVYLQQHGNFRHDVKVRVYIQADHRIVGSNSLAVTKVSVTVRVENVTLTRDEMTELFNRVPVQKLESYFPSPFFTEEVEDWVPENSTGGQRGAAPVPWYAILGGTLSLSVFVVILVVILRRQKVIWWLPRRKRSDASVMFSQNGSPNLSILSGNQELERINLQPRLQPITNLLPSILAETRTQFPSGSDTRSYSLPAGPSADKRRSGAPSLGSLTRCAERSEQSRLRPHSELVWTRLREADLTTSCDSGSIPTVLNRSSQVGQKDKGLCYVTTGTRSSMDINISSDGQGGVVSPPPDIWYLSDGFMSE